MNKKSAPTPKRSERQAQNITPLIPKDRKMAKRLSKEAAKKHRLEIREAIASGDEKYLRASERGPQKKFLRDYIDSRLSAGEFVLPFMFLVLVIGIVPEFVQFSHLSLIAIWLYLIFSVIEAILIAQSVKRKIKNKIGAKRLDKGFILPSIMRTMQPRKLRMPRATVKRFSDITVEKYIK